MHAFSFRALLAALALTLVPISATLAQTTEPVQLTPGFTKLIRFDRPIATVVIGNPEVADARAQTDRSIALVGKAVGITNLIALDNTGTEVFSSLVVVGARDAGKVIINSRKALHEYWAYRCTADNCVRVEDRLEYLQPSAPIVVAPIAPAGAPAPTN
jgi:Flp pilus assembly secretin CpaC